MTRTVGIIALKGGVGKTTTVAALGATLVKHFKRRVLVVDANFTAPNLGIHLGIFNPEKTLQDVCMSKIPIRDAIYATDYGVDLLPSSVNGVYHDVFMLKKVLKNISSEYDIILVDSSPNLRDEILATMIASDELYVVTTPDFPTLSCTLKAIKVAKQKRTPIHGLILNKIRKKSFELSLSEIEETAETKVLAVIPDDVNILKSLAKSVPPTLQNETSEATIEFRKFAAFLLREKYNDPRITRKLKTLLFNQYPLQDVNKEIVSTEFKKVQFKN